MASGDPWFIGILSGSLSGALSYVGVLWTQRATNRREDKGRRWQERRTAYVDFLVEQARLDAVLTRYTCEECPGELSGPLSDDWHEMLRNRLILVEFVGSQDAAVAARRLYRATVELADGGVAVQFRASEAQEQFRRVVQRDLDLPVTELPEWGHEDDERWSQTGVVHR